MYLKTLVDPIKLLNIPTAPLLHTREYIAFGSVIEDTLKNIDYISVGVTSKISYLLSFIN